VGDPSAWSRACAALEAVRAAARPRGARLIVAIVQVTGAIVLRQRRASGQQIWDCTSCPCMALLQPPPAGALPLGSDCFVGDCPNKYDTVLQDAPLGVELPDELTAMLARQAGVDRKCVVMSPGGICFPGLFFPTHWHASSCSRAVQYACMRLVETRSFLHWPLGSGCHRQQHSALWRGSRRSHPHCLPLAGAWCQCA